jgi:hypothetical protein
MSSANVNGNGHSDVPQKADRWAAIAGNWRFEGAGGTYSSSSAGGDASRDTFGIALSSLRLPNGVVSLDVELSDSTSSAGGVVVGFESLRRPYVVVSLGGWDRAYAIGQYLPELGWEALELAGSASNLKSTRPYHLEIRLTGQRLELIVDDVPVMQTTLPRPLAHAGFGLYAYGGADVTFQNVLVKREGLRAFVIMPFREPFDSLYSDVIQPVAERSHDVVVERADEIKGPGVILDDIQRKIERSDLVVAEISESNPNVFYELGYAHALRKPTILLVRRDYSDNLPFDVRGFRVIMYHDTIAGKKDVESELEQYLDAIKQS